jgi:predicted GNAT family acetyltransferase
MAEIKLELNTQKQGGFNLYDESGKAGEMVVTISGDKLTVYHTEVAKEASGKGYAKQLLDAMVAYVRGNKLSVIVLCPYVHAQFKKHPELYSDIWSEQINS